MIDVEISIKYSIVPYGTNGMEVQKNDRQIKVFNNGESPEINWQNAVKWCEKNY